MQASGVSITRRALSLAPAASVVTSCLAGRRHEGHQGTYVVASTKLKQSASPFPPSCFHLAQRAQETSTGALFMRGLDAAQEAIRGALRGRQSGLFLGTGVLNGPRNAYLHDNRRGLVCPDNVFYLSRRAASSLTTAEAPGEAQANPENADSFPAAEGIGSSGELESEEPYDWKKEEEMDARTGPPAQAIAYVFDLAETLCKRGYNLRDVDPRLEDLVYTPLVMELLKSWHAYPDEFESAFWDALMKLQAREFGAHRVNGFVANFLVDEEAAVGDKTPVSLLGPVIEQILVEARTNPDTVQVENLALLALQIQNSFNETGLRHRSPDLKVIRSAGRLSEEFQRQRMGNWRELQVLEENFPQELPPWFSHNEVVEILRRRQQHRKRRAYFYSQSGGDETDEEGPDERMHDTKGE